MENVVLSDQFNISYGLIRFWMFVTLNKIQAQICPKEKLNDQVEYDLDGIICGSKCSIEHWCNAGVSNKQKDENVKNSLPFVVCINNDSLFASFLLIFYFKIWLICLIFTRKPIIISIRSSWFEDLWRSAGSVNNLLFSLLVSFISIHHHIIVSFPVDSSLCRYTLNVSSIFRFILSTFHWNLWDIQRLVICALHFIKSIFISCFSWFHNHIV